GNEVGARKQVLNAELPPLVRSDAPLLCRACHAHHDRSRRHARPGGILHRPAQRSVRVLPPHWRAQRYAQQQCKQLQVFFHTSPAPNQQFRGDRGAPSSRPSSAPYLDTLPYIVACLPVTFQATPFPPSLAMRKLP